VSLVERETKHLPPPGLIPSITSRLVGSARLMTSPAMKSVRPMTLPAKKRLHLIGSTRAMPPAYTARTWLASRALPWWRRHSEWIGGPPPCENIHSWISLVGDLVFSHQGEIYGFKFPKRIFGDLFQRSHSFLSSPQSNHLKT